MAPFDAPIAESVWDMKYRLRDAAGAPVDARVEDTWARVARAVASVEPAWANQADRVSSRVSRSACSGS